MQYASFKNTSSSNGCLCLTCFIVSKLIIDSVHCDNINLVGGRGGDYSFTLINLNTLMDIVLI